MEHGIAWNHRDHYKYSLVRYLAREGDMRVNVCWMLTPDEPGNEQGRDLDYLKLSGRVGAREFPSLDLFSRSL